jgi:DNA-binding MarR family transcriptional regulator
VILLENKRLERMVDNIIVFFPLFHRKLINMNEHYKGIAPFNPRFRLLGALHWCGPTAMSEIGNRISVSKPHMTALIDDLIKEGMVHRKYDSKDRRVIKISITKKGKSFLISSKKETVAVIKKNISYLDQKEQETLYDSFESIKNILTKINPTQKTKKQNC